MYIKTRGVCARYLAADKIWLMGRQWNWIGLLMMTALFRAWNMAQMTLLRLLVIHKTVFFTRHQCHMQKSCSCINYWTLVMCYVPRTRDLGYAAFVPSNVAKQSTKRAHVQKSTRGGAMPSSSYIMQTYQKSDGTLTRHLHMNLSFADTISMITSRRGHVDHAR